MTKHWRYLKAVLRHKWFVFVAGRDRGVPLWQLVVHDWSKFTPWEWSAYAEWFNGFDGGPWHPVLAAAKKGSLIPVPRSVNTDVTSGLAHPSSALGMRVIGMAEARQRAFMQAFLFHLHVNPHHHQYWRLPSHGDKPGQVFAMPDRYVREMLADWDGAGRAYNGVADTPGWYAKQTDIVLHQDTRDQVERMLALR